MHRIYNVYSGRLHIDFVIATSEEEACKYVYKKWGDPCNYTNTSDGTYWAKEV